MGQLDDGSWGKQLDEKETKYFSSLRGNVYIPSHNRPVRRCGLRRGAASREHNGPFPGGVFFRVTRQ